MSATAPSAAAPPPAEAAPARAGRRAATAADFAYDALVEGLQSGRFGGRPSPGPGPVALVETLRGLAWPVDERAFAAAVPHFPERFGPSEIRSTLHNLGFATRRARLSGRSLPDVPGAVLVLGARGAIGVVGAGRPAPIVDAATGHARRARARGRHDCILAEEADAQTGRPGQRLLPAMLARFRPELSLIVVLTLLSGATVVAASLSIGLIFTTVLRAEALDTLIAVLLGIAALFALELALRRIRSRVVARLSGRLEFVLSTEVYAKLMGLPIEMITGSGLGDQMRRLKQFETVRDFFGGPVVSVLLELPLVAIMLAALAVISWPCALAALAGIGACAFVGAVAVPRIRAAQAALAGRQSDYARLLEETLAQREEIVRRGLGAAVADRLRPHHRRLARARMTADLASRGLGAAIAVLAPLTSAGVLGVGALEVVSGAMPGGALIVATILTMRLMAPVQQALMVAVRGPEILDLFRQLDALLRLPGRRATAAAPTAAGSRRLTIEAVVFGYPGAAAPALRGLSLRVPPGSLVAIGGPSGAGKSTLLRAVMGDHALRSGRVLLGPLNLAQISPERRSGLIGHLGHRPFLIYGTVAQNLALGAPEASGDAMRAVCDELGLLPAIEALPGGFDARLDVGLAAAVTPALRTKLALARLLLRRPPILLLDEPGARLSPTDEARLMDAIRRRTAEGATCLVVTHRPSVMRTADRALLLEAGRGRFYGSPAEIPRPGPAREPQ